MKFVHKFLQYNTKVKDKIRNQYKTVLNKKSEDDGSGLSMAPTPESASDLYQLLIT